MQSAGEVGSGRHKEGGGGCQRSMCEHSRCSDNAQQAQQTRPSHDGHNNIQSPSTTAMCAGRHPLDAPWDRAEACVKELRWVDEVVGA